MSDVFRGYGVKVMGLERESFLKVRETLTRVGRLIEDNTVLQECFVLHKKGSYAVLHASELRMMDGIDTEPTTDDIALRNTVAYLLDSWGLIELEDPQEVSQPRAPVGQIIVVPFKAKKNYTLSPDYEIGKTKGH